MRHIIRLRLTAMTFAALLSVPAGLANAAATGQAEFMKECSACHMAYPPVLLPQRSWKAIMGNLSNHFGGDASLDPKTTKNIEAFLVANAADANGRRSGVLDGLSPDKTPLRITDMPWFNIVHGDRARAYAKSHPAIKTIANCTGCHRSAANGGFGDD